MTVVRLTSGRSQTAGGISGYGVQFGFEQYENMAARMRKLQGRAIVSLNAHPDIRRFRRFPHRSD